MKLLHYPDKPNLSDAKSLALWDESGEYICEQKIDGFRMLVIKDESAIRFVSRHGKDFTSEISSAIVKEVKSLIMPPNSILDGEWRSRRSCSVKLALPQHLYVFDVMRWDGKWMLDVPLEERLEKLSELEIPEGDIWYDGNGLGGCISVIPRAFPGYFKGFYEVQKDVSWSEGVVVKDKKSTLVGDMKTSGKNPRWFKVKYRM